MNTFQVSHQWLLPMIDSVMALSGFKKVETVAEPYCRRFIQSAPLVSGVNAIIIALSPLDENSVLCSARFGLCHGLICNAIKISDSGNDKATRLQIRGVLDTFKSEAVDLINLKHHDRPPIVPMWANLSFNPLSERLDAAQWHFYALPSADVSGPDHARAMAFSLALKACASFGDAVPSKTAHDDGDTGFICYTSERAPEAFKPVIRSEFRIQTKID